MKFGNSISTRMGKYGTFSGRAIRSEYWWFYLFTVLMSWGATLVAGSMFSFGDPMGEVLPLIVSLAFFVPVIAAGSRRLHDIGKSGWWQLLFIIPIIGWILLIVWMCTDSEKEKNFYGSNPKIGDANNLDENVNKSTQPNKNEMINAGSISDKIKELNNLKEQGLISEDDFQQKKKSLLDGM